MLDELRKIVLMDGITQEDGKHARLIALNFWIEKYVAELVIENSVIKKHLNASEYDYLKHFQCFQLAEKLLENHAEVITEGNKISVKTLVLNKYYPKNKKE